MLQCNGTTAHHPELSGHNGINNNKLKTVIDGVCIINPALKQQCEFS